MDLEVSHCVQPVFTRISCLDSQLQNDPSIRMLCSSSSSACSICEIMPSWVACQRCRSNITVILKALQARNFSVPPRTKTALTNVRVFDGYHIHQSSTVVIDGSIISFNTCGVSSVIDGCGGILLPGLIDSHCHVSSLSDLEALSSYGVTTAMDMNCRIIPLPIPSQSSRAYYYAHSWSSSRGSQQHTRNTLPRTRKCSCLFTCAGNAVCCRPLQQRLRLLENCLRAQWRKSGFAGCASPYYACSRQAVHDPCSGSGVIPNGDSLQKKMAFSTFPSIVLSQRKWQNKLQRNTNTSRQL